MRDGNVGNVGTWREPQCDEGKEAVGKWREQCSPWGWERSAALGESSGWVWGMPA